MYVEVVEKYLDKHPALEKFIDAGTISLKVAREILDVDRWYMNDMFKDLLMAGAVVSSGSSSWRATKELKEYLKKRREENRNANQ